MANESNPHQLTAVYSTTTFMRRIDLRLAVTASAVLAVSLLVLVTLNSTPPPPTSGRDPATGGQMLGTQAITTDELVRRVTAGQISSITVMGDHAVATTVDNDLFTAQAQRAGHGRHALSYIRAGSAARVRAPHLQVLPAVRANQDENGRTDPRWRTFMTSSSRAEPLPSHSYAGEW